MKKLVILVIFVAVLCSFIPVVAVHASSVSRISAEIPALSENCMPPPEGSGVYCQDQVSWGTYPNDPSYGASTDILMYGCVYGSTDCLVNSKAFLAQFLQNDVRNGTTGYGAMAMGIDYRNTSADLDYCNSDVGKGTFMFVDIWGIDGRRLVTDCWTMNTSSYNPGDLMYFSMNRCFSCGNGGLEAWIVDETAGETTQCYPCTYIQSNYGDDLPSTFHNTTNQMLFDDNMPNNPVATTNQWTYNMFQTTDGKWHYQTNNGTITSSKKPPMYMWWAITPSGSTTGGDLNACITDTSSDCTSL